MAELLRARDDNRALHALGGLVERHDHNVAAGLYDAVLDRIGEWTSAHERPVPPAFRLIIVNCLRGKARAVFRTRDSTVEQLEGAMDWMVYCRRRRRPAGRPGPARGLPAHLGPGRGPVRAAPAQAGTPAPGHGTQAEPAPGRQADPARQRTPGGWTSSANARTVPTSTAAGSTWPAWRSNWRRPASRDSAPPVSTRPGRSTPRSSPSARPATALATWKKSSPASTASPSSSTTGPRCCPPRAAAALRLAASGRRPRPRRHAAAPGGRGPGGRPQHRQVRRAGREDRPGAPGPAGRRDRSRIGPVRHPVRPVPHGTRHRHIASGGAPPADRSGRRTPSDRTGRRTPSDRTGRRTPSDRTGRTPPAPRSHPDRRSGTPPAHRQGQPHAVLLHAVFLHAVFLHTVLLPAVLPPPVPLPTVQNVPAGIEAWIGSEAMRTLVTAFDGDDKFLLDPSVPLTERVTRLHAFSARWEDRPDGQERNDGFELDMTAQVRTSSWPPPGHWDCTVARRRGTATTTTSSCSAASYAPASTGPPSPRNSSAAAPCTPRVAWRWRAPSLQELGEEPERGRVPARPEDRSPPSDGGVRGPRPGDPTRLRPAVP